MFSVRFPPKPRRNTNDFAPCSVSCSETEPTKPITSERDEQIFFLTNKSVLFLAKLYSSSNYPKSNLGLRIMARLIKKKKTPNAETQNQISWGNEPKR